jgi:hypothetical protein
MTIDFDWLSGTADLEARDPRVAIVRGLIVAERPRRADFLNVEEKCFRETSTLPSCLFIESDDETGAETFANAQQFADAMALAPGQLPTQDQAATWHAEKAGAALEAWRDRLAEAWAAPK